MSDTIARRAEDVESRTASIYPNEFQHVVKGRAKRALGDLFGLDQFGVNLTELAPGAASALRHWHSNEDEFVYVLAGELLLITDNGEEVLGPGDCAGFKAGVANGHHLVNRSKAPASYLEIGSRMPGGEAFYPDNDLHIAKGIFTRKDGSPV